ncbi:hypothetical protein GCM10023258_00810 [Terrabacter aeriphilus]|uniref:IPT/TIG domain-containing protein n=1 Tax=Terrabacter aeriphilus TaxID=515662 RepID=A0ABP9J172_9MICO
MLPRPTRSTAPAPGGHRRAAGRTLSVLLALAMIAGVPGLVGAPTATAAVPAPEGVSLSVVAGPVRGGTSVDLSGPGVGATTRVWFGAASVTEVTRVSATRVRVKTPVHAAALVNVRVTTPAGTSPLTLRSTFAYEAVPSVTGLSTRTSSTAGQATVTITGSGLYRASSVHFGTTPASGLTRVSRTQVRVTAPAHAAGVVDVRVTTPGGTSPVVAAGRFRYAAPAQPAPLTPVVTGLSTRSGSTAGGTVVTLTGQRLTGATRVLFGATTGTRLVRVSATQVRVTSPRHSAGTVDVRVTTSAGGNSAVSTRARFLYVAPKPVPAPLPPVVTGLSTRSGSTAGGTVVTLTGQRLTGATRVLFGATTGTRLVRVSATQVRVTSPRHSAGTVDVRVTTSAGGNSAVSTRARFLYVAPKPVPVPTAPVVAGLAPSSGPVKGGTVVTVTGVRLTGATRVTFDGVAATKLVRVSATRVRATAPAHGAGSADVRVTTPHGTSPAVATGRFTYVGAPVVTSLSVVAGPLAGGSVVVIGGRDLAGATSVTFGSTRATFTVLSATSVRATVPAHAAGLVNVHVATASGSSKGYAANAYAYVETPTLTSVSPTVGSATGGTVVTLTGTDLSRASEVRFGDTPARSVVRVSATTVRATTPAHDAGPVDVRVVTPGGTSPATSRARFLFGFPPVLRAMSATAGPVAGGTVVTLTGAHLGNATQVRFGGSTATGLTRVSDSTIRVTTPAHAGSTVTVTVTTPSGTSPVGPATLFRYVAVPVVASLSAPAGPIAGGTVLVVRGSGLALATQVELDGADGSALTVVSDRELRVTTPAHAAGPTALRVTTPGGVSATGPSATFEYQPVPTLRTVSPGLARTDGGTIVTVTGTGFTRVSAVSFGGTDAPAVTTVSDTTLRVTLPAHAEQDVDVRVTTPGGTSPVVAAGRFTFQDPPAVAAVSPASGPLAGGTVVTLRGTSFTDVTGVWFNGVAAQSFTRVSATTLTAVAPPRVATGAVPMRVSTRAGTVVEWDAFTFVSGATLRTGQVLSSGTALRSPNGAYFATMQPDGNLVITTAAGARRWASGSKGAQSRLVVGADGDIDIVRPDRSVAWSSGTSGWTGGLVTLTNDGILQVRSGTTTVWDHRGNRYDRMLPGQVLRGGESIVSANGAYRLTMGTDGGLELRSSTGARQWTAYTSGAGNYAKMLTGGNFVVRNASGTTIWSTRTSTPGSVIRVLNNANAAVYGPSSVLWTAVGAAAPSGWTCYSRATQDCIERFGYYGQRAWNYPVDAWGNNCTNYSAFRLSQDGVRNPGNLGNATSWDDNARSKGFAVDQRPRVGDIAQWNSNHVAYVDWVSSDGDQVAISESGYGGYVLGKTYTSMSGRRIISRGSSSWPSNFIHFR